jgi:regulator of protease activity HflC (stomatin/prohibitin superfamily)
MTGQVILFVILFLVIALSVSSIRIVRQSFSYVVERLGAFHHVAPTGLTFIIPIIERVAQVVSLKERVADFKPQPVITKDNVTMQIDTVVYYQVTDARLYTYGVEKPVNALENLTATTLRNIIGELELDQTLTSRDTINNKMRIILDEATDPWGIKVNRVELKNILPPREIQEAMEKQMRAEREKRESILIAEGQKSAAILTAEGQKQSAILKAQAQRQSNITVAEGEAEALLTVYKAQANGIKLINEARPSREYVTLESYKTLEKVAQGNATKLIIPSDIQNLAGTVAALAETIKVTNDDQPKKEKEKK